MGTLLNRTKQYDVKTFCIDAFVKARNNQLWYIRTMRTVRKKKNLFCFLPSFPYNERDAKATIRGKNTGNAYSAEVTQSLKDSHRHLKKYQ